LETTGGIANKLKTKARKKKRGRPKTAKGGEQKKRIYLLGKIIALTCRCKGYEGFRSSKKRGGKGVLKGKTRGRLVLRKLCSCASGAKGDPEVEKTKT